MKHLQFNIEINATAEKIYSFMIDEDGFEEWVAVFSPGSYFEGSWEKDGKISYLSPDENGDIQGMISVIQKNIPNKELFIKPIGVIQNGQEILEGDMVEGLDEAYENYLFQQNDNATLLTIKVAVYEELVDYFNDMWPKALKKIKEICEE
jgi:hypothetical protein